MACIVKKQLAHSCVFLCLNRQTQQATMADDQDHSPAHTEGNTLLGAGTDTNTLKHQGTNICLLFVAIIICLGSLQFGYHIGVINSPENVIRKCGLYNETSDVHYPLNVNNTNFFQPCVPMSDDQWAWVTNYTLLNIIRLHPFLRLVV